MNHTMNEIEELASKYARARDALRERIREAQTAVDAVKRRHHAVLRRRIDAVKNAHRDLLDTVEESPELFAKPKTRLLHGIKVGWRKRPGRIEVTDEAATISAIKKKFDENTVEKLVQVREKLNRRGLRDLSARDLMRIGAVAIADSDEPIALLTDSETDKLVDALLEVDEPIEEEAA